MLFADETLSALGGWPQLVLQGGAFGLLTYIVVRLVPQQMQISAEERTARDTRFVEALTALEVKRDAQIERLIGATTEQTRSINATIEKGSDKTADALVRLASSECPRDPHGPRLKGACP